MTDKQLADQVIAELRQTTVGWNKVAGYSPAKLATTHWGKAMSLLGQIGTVTPPPPSAVYPSKTSYPSEAI